MPYHDVRWMEEGKGGPGPDPNEWHGRLLHPPPGGEGGEEALEGLSGGQAVQETPGLWQDDAGGDFAVIFIFYTVYGKHLQ